MWTRFKRWSLGFSIFLLSPLCLAAQSDKDSDGVYLQVSLFPTYSGSNTGVGSLGGNFDGEELASESGFSYQVQTTLGYRFAYMIFLGGTMTSSSTSSKRLVSTSAPSLKRTTTASEMGPSVGFFPGNWRFMGTYFLKGTKKRTELQIQNDGETAADFTLENKGGKGYQVQIGYCFTISNNFRIGPTLIYRKMSYTKQSLTNAVDAESDYTDQVFTTKATESSLTPMLTLVLQF